MRITLKGKPDASLLNEELALALGGWAKFLGCHNTDEAIVECAEADEATVRSTVEAHLARTPEQQAAAVNDHLARLTVDGIDRLQFEHLYDLANRTRTLEARPTITRAVYRQALIDRWKLLNP